MNKSIVFVLLRSLALVFLTGFALLESRDYLIEHFGLPLFQILLMPVLMLAIWLGAGDWLAQLRAKKKGGQNVR